MACERIGNTIVCGRGASAPKCAFCRKRSTKLCDHVMGKTIGGADITCDLPLCDDHALAITSLDFCPKHAPQHRAALKARG